MKRVFTLLVAMLIAATTFAQFTPRVVKDKAPVKIANKEAVSVASSEKNADHANFWFNFADALETYWGMELSGFGPPILCDLNGVYPFSDGNSPVQFMSFGQVYDWAHACWEEFYSQPDYDDQTVPYLGFTNQYSIDSLKLCFFYHWGTNVPTTTVDTVRISYVLNLDDEEIYQPLYYTDTTYTEVAPRFSVIRIPYDNQNYTPAYSVWIPRDTAYAELGSNALIINDDLLLTNEDVTDSTWFYYFNLPVPEELTNISCKKMAVNVTFIPGNDRTDSSVIGTDINIFRTILYDDPRPEWNTSFSEELLGDVQCGTFTDDWNYDETKTWYGYIQPNMFWQGNPKPVIGLHATCNDCAVVPVPEIENATATIYPNPASSVINVVTNTSEKVNIEMFNLVGQKVYSEQVVNSTKIDVSNMKPGVYMLRVNNHTTKVVVK